MGYGQFIVYSFDIYEIIQIAVAFFFFKRNNIVEQLQLLPNLLFYKLAPHTVRNGPANDVIDRVSCLRPLEAPGC